MPELGVYLKPEQLDTRNIILDGHHQPRPERVAFLRFLYLKRQLTPENPHIAKSLMTELLYENQPKHIDAHIFQPPTDLNRPETIAIDRVQNRTLYALGDSPPDQWRNWHKLVETLQKGWERGISNLPQYEGQIRELKDFIRASVEILADKYDELRKNVSESEKEEFTQSIKSGHLEEGFIEKFTDHFFPGKLLFRLAFEIWAKSVTVFAYSYGIKEQLGLEIDPFEVINENVSMLLEAQNDEGYWGFGEHPQGLRAKDTGLIIHSLGIGYKTFGDKLLFDKGRISKSKEFLEDSLVPTGDGLACEVKREYIFQRQITFNATFESLLGLYYANLMLGKDRESIFSDERIIGIIRYLLSLQTDGSFSMSPDSPPDLEATAVIPYTFFDRNQLHMNTEEMKNIADFQYGQVIHYLHRNKRKLQERFSQQQHLHVPILCANSLLLCGVWPFSSHIIGTISRTTEYMKRDLDEIKRLPLWEGFTKRSSYKLISPLLPIKFSKFLAMLNVTLHAISCLKILEEYNRDPEKYWQRVKETSILL